MKYAGFNAIIGVYAAARYYFNALRLKVKILIKISLLMVKQLLFDQNEILK
jgi:hypothetical protein